MAKDAETFVIKIDGSKDAAWQGEVTWAEELFRCRQCEPPTDRNTGR